MAGIGLFLAHIGMQAGNGIDIIRSNAAVKVDVTFLEAPYAARCWVGIAIFILTAVLITLKVPGAIVRRSGGGLEPQAYMHRVAPIECIV